MSEVKKLVNVKLTTGSDKKAKTRMFDIDHANRVLKLSNSQWKLDDPNYKWNGTEIAKVVKK